MSHTPATCDYKPDNYTFNNFMTILYSFRFRAWIVILFLLLMIFFIIVYPALPGTIITPPGNYPGLDFTSCATIKMLFGFGRPDFTGSHLII